VLVENTAGVGGISGEVTVGSSAAAPGGPGHTGWRMHGGIGNPESGEWTRYILPRTAARPAGTLAAVDAASTAPRFYRASFNASPPAEIGPHPILRVVLAGMSRGFVWLNGHNLGRYPEKVPVEGLYLPEPWLIAGGNSLVIFDEEGHGVGGVHLQVEKAASREVSEIGKP